MISEKKYREAKKIVKQYELEQSKKPPIKHFEIGDVVETSKGCRFRGPFTGIVVGYGKWCSFDAVKVKKDINGKTVLCLAKNLT